MLRNAVVFMAVALLSVALPVAASAFAIESVQGGGDDAVSSSPDRGLPSGDMFPSHDPDYVIVSLTDNAYGDNQAFPNGYYFVQPSLNSDGTKIAVVAKNKVDTVTQPAEIWVMDYDAVTQTVSGFQKITSTGGTGDVLYNTMVSWSRTNADLLMFLEVHATSANIVKTYDLSTSSFAIIYDPALDTNGLDATNPAFLGQSDGSIVVGTAYGSVHDKIVVFDGSYPSTTISCDDQNLDPSSNRVGDRVTYYSTQADYAQGSIYSEHSGGSWTENQLGFGDPSLRTVPGYWACYSGKSDDMILALRSELGWSATGLGLYDSAGLLVSDLLGNGGTDFKFAYPNHNWEGPGGEALFRAEEYAHAGYGNNIFIAMTHPYEVWVDDSWTGPSDCGGHAWGYDAFASVNEAMGVVADGGTVNVGPGLYTERVVVDRPLTLLGATHAANKNGYTVPALYAWDTGVESVIDYPDPTGAIADQVAVDIRSDNVTFKGFVVQILNARVGSDHLLRLDAQIGGGTGTYLSNVVVENNVLGPVTNSTLQDGTYGRMGLYLASPTYPAQRQGIRDTHIAGNKIIDARGNGNNVFIWGAAEGYGSLQNADYTGTVIEDNEICGSHRSGIEIAGGVSNLTIQENAVHNNSSTNGGPSDANLKYGNGIILIRMGADKMSPTALGCADLAVEGNDIYGNEKNGIYLGPINGGYTISANVIRDNGWDGLRLDLTEQYYGGTWPVYDKTTDIAVTECSLTGNSLKAVQVVGAPTNGFVLDASGCWFGTTSAAAVAGNVSGYVDYSPWLGGGTLLSPGFDGDYSTLWVDGDSPRVGTTGYVQEGVNLVSGSTVNVLDGTYTEQVIIERAVNLRGPNAGIDPNTGTRVAEAEIHTDDLNTHQAVLIQSPDVTVDGFTLYGPNGSVKDIGAVGLSGAGARTNVHVQYNRIFRTAGGMDWNGDGIRMDPPSNAAASIYIEHNRIQVGTTQPEGNNDITIADHAYRMAYGDAWTVGDPDRVVIRHNDVYGHGKMYIEGIGVLIEDNDFLGIWGPIEVRGAKDVVITDNRMVNQYDIGIFAWSPQVGASGAGLCTDLVISDNTITGTHLDPQDFTDDGSAVVLGGVTNATVTNNALTGNAGCGVVVAGIGYDHFDPEDGNNWGGLLHVGYDPVNNVLHWNAISGNTNYGVNNYAYGVCTVDATYNWWGSADGPTLGKGFGVSTGVTYDPWIGKAGGENVVCDPDPQVISLADLVGGSYKDSVVVKYLGGGSGLVYGYSIDVEWNVAVVSASFARPDNGPFSTCALFMVTSVGSGHARIDAGLGGLAPGISAGELFKATFTAVGTPDYATSPVTLTLIKIRDVGNTPLSGFYSDDGQIIVDLVAPAVAVAITNPAVFAVTGSHEWFKSGDALTVTATVADGGGLASVVADLSQLGGGGAVPGTPPSPYVWNQTAGGGNGDKIASVTATDTYGNGTVGLDHITADNVVPGTVAGFAAAPGHEKVHLSWTDLSSLPDQDYYAVKVQYRPWNNYPYYSTAAPEYPENAAAGLNAFFGDAASATHTITARDIYYYSAFVCDWALNCGTVAGQDRSTNYWLGDVAAGWASWAYNGLVDENDINNLGGAYGVAPSNEHNAECNVGPTDDHGRLGIPVPDGLVDFEDLMMFALNYGVVSPLGRIVPFLPAPADEVLALSLEEFLRSTEGEVQVALRLGGNVGDVKGISTVITYDASQLEFVGARLSEAMSSPLADMFFWSGLEDGKVLVDLAVLGTGVAIGGSGDVAVLTFRALGGEYALGFDEALIRGVENEELTADLQGLESRPGLPTVFRLSQNVPNPFNPKTTVAYEVPQVCEVTIRVYDVAGRLVTTLVDGTVEPGRYAATWDGRGDAGEAVGSGVYFCVMETPEYRAAHKMMLLK